MRCLQKQCFAFGIWKPTSIERKKWFQSCWMHSAAVPTPCYIFLARPPTPCMYIYRRNSIGPNKPPVCSGQVLAMPWKHSAKDIGPRCSGLKGIGSAVHGSPKTMTSIRPTSSPFGVNGWELAANQKPYHFPRYIYIYVEPNQFHGHVLNNTCPVYILINGLHFVLRATPMYMNISNAFLFVYILYTI